MRGAQKSALRQVALARRAEAAQTCPEAAARVAGHLSEILAGYREVPVAGYVAVRSEADPAPALEEAAAHGIIGLPVVVAADAPLEFHRWEPGAPLRKGAFGVPQPCSAAPITPEIIVVPLVAFDARGARLGYGGGFYDRTLHALRTHGAILAVGLAFDEQQLDEVPTGPHDQPLDLIATQSGVLDPRI